MGSVLLVGSGLLLKSLYRLLTVDTGFPVSRLTTFYVFPTANRYATDEQQINLHRSVLEKLRALAGA